MRKLMTAMCLSSVILSASVVDTDAWARPFSSSSSSSSSSTSSKSSTGYFSRHATTASKVTGFGGSAPSSLRASPSATTSTLGRATSLSQARSDLTRYQTQAISPATPSTPRPSYQPSYQPQVASRTYASPQSYAAAPVAPSPSTKTVYVHHYDSDPLSGMATGIILGQMMSHLSQPDYAQWAYEHRADPDFVAWKQQQLAQASSDPALKQKIEGFGTTAVSQVQAPQAVTDQPETAVAPTVPVSHASHGSHAGLVILLLLLAAAIAVGAVLVRSRFARKAVKQVAHDFIDKADAVVRPKTPAPSVPLGLIPGTAVAFGAEVRAACLSDDSLFPSMPDDGARVDSVGTMTLSGRKVVRAYLSDNASFIQMVMPEGSDEPEEAVLFTSVRRDTPDQAALSWLLDGETGSLGAPTFSVVTAGGDIVFDREWGQGAGRVQPVRSTETIMGMKDGSYTVLETVDYQMMAYVRQTSEGPEHLMVELASNASQAEINMSVGNELTDETLRVFRTS